MHGEWLHWYYLIYLLPGGAAVATLLMSGLGGVRGGHGHAQHGVSHVGGAHGHAPALGGHHHSPPVAHGHGAAPEHAHAHGHRHAPAQHRAETPGVGRQLLGLVGVGRAPLTVVLGSLLIGWGVCGFAATEALRPLLRWPALFVGPSLVIAAVGALLTGRVFAEIAARLMPQDETYAITQEGLIGRTGRVVYPITETSGRVHVYDQFHTLHVAPARVAAGEPEIAKGADVIVVSADPARRYLLVEPLGFRAGQQTSG